MKKLFSLIAFVGCLLIGTHLEAQHSVPRFGILKNEGNTGASLTYKYQTITTTTATAVLYQAPNAWETVIKIGTLTHALTDSLKTAGAWVGDRVIFIFTADTLTAGRVVTFGNNIKSTGTLTVPRSKKATARFVFDGVAWLEESRALMAN